MQKSNPLLLVFCIIVLVIFFTSLFFIYQRTTIDQQKASASILLYAASSLPILAIIGIALILLLGIIYVLSNILQRFSSTQAMHYVEIAEALNQHKHEPNRIIINAMDKKSLQSSNQYQLPESSKQHRQIKYNGIDNFENAKLNLNEFLVD